MRQDEEDTRTIYYEARGHILEKLRTFVRNYKGAMRARENVAARLGATGFVGREGVYYVLKFNDAPLMRAWRYDQVLRGYVPRLATPEGRELHWKVFTEETKVPTMTGFCRAINFDPWQEYPNEVFPGIHQVADKWYIALPPYFKPRTCRALVGVEAVDLVKMIKGRRSRIQERRLATA